MESHKSDITMSELNLTLNEDLGGDSFFDMDLDLRSDDTTPRKEVAVQADSVPDKRLSWIQTPRFSVRITSLAAFVVIFFIGYHHSNFGVRR